MKRIVRATAVALALGSVVSLSACGQTATAATVNGTTITEEDLNTVVREINGGLELQQPLTAEMALNMLIAAPTFLAYGQKHGIQVPESQVRAVFPIQDPSPATIEVLRLNQVGSSLSQEQQNEATGQMADLTVTVNPKYGTFDPAQLTVVPAEPNWLTAPAG